MEPTKQFASIKRDAVLGIFFVMTLFMLSGLLSAQRTETVLYKFCPDGEPHCPDGEAPWSGALAADSQGSLYGTTFYGGAHGEGVVYRLSPPPGGHGSWTETVLYSFCSLSRCTDGKLPYSGVILDAEGNLYGTTSAGGAGINGGVVYELSPPPGGDGAWTETVLYSFCLHYQSCPDGGQPHSGLVFDSRGNLYGTTHVGGATNSGTVYELSPPPGGHGQWTEQVIYIFCPVFGCLDGWLPEYGSLIFDSSGSLYGTTTQGGPDDAGVVFKLTPSGGQYWNQTVLYSFCNPCNDGRVPYAGVIFDRQGNLYGTTTQGGLHGNGTVFELTPPAGGSGPWNETLPLQLGFEDGSGPTGGLTFDAAGHLYGTAPNEGAHNSGVAFQLDRAGGGGWNDTTIYSFCSLPNCTDGKDPSSSVIVDRAGNLYGTTSRGGFGWGAVYELPAIYVTTTTLSSTPNPADLGQVLTITATVTAQAGHTPNGTVVFNANGSEIGSASLNNSGVAELQIILNPGTYNLTAVYQSAAMFAGSTSNTVVQVVNPYRASTTTVLSSLNPSILGQAVTFTGSVGPARPPAPTGSLSFQINGYTIPGCSDVPLSFSHTAQCTTSNFLLGWDPIVATYSGDSNYGSSSGLLYQIVNPVPTPLQFVAVTPCRVADTRNDGFGPIFGGMYQDFAITSFGPCSIPDAAQAYSLNVTVLPHRSLGYLTIWPANQLQPIVSTLNSSDGRVKASAAIVAAGSGENVSVYVTDTSDVILDIDGYFVQPGAHTLQFYPLAPCRVVDTRQTNFPHGLGAPRFGNMETRELPVLANSPCLQGLPHTPQAYSFNVTVAPNPSGQQLNYLTIWPSNQHQPLVSTLNNPTATAVANAAIVPADPANGEVSVFTYNSTDVIIDVNGYFAAPGPGGYSFYPLTPCRAYDSRNNSGQPFTGERTVNVAGGPCAPSASAAGYVFNATVVPSGSLGYLTLWPHGQQQEPVVSTLNAYDGFITSNMAIVPNLDGSTNTDAAYGYTHLILDISGYFAP